MQTTANNSFFLKTISSFSSFAESPKTISHAGLYQQIVSELTKSVTTKQSLKHLSNTLVKVAANAIELRRMDVLEEVSQLLLNIPLPRQYTSVGRYYQALCMNRQGEVVNAQTLLERVSEDGPLLYRAKAMMSMGTIYWQSGNYTSALPLYSEALRAANNKECCDLPTLIETHRGIAVLKSLDGNHHGALAHLENLVPVVRAVGSYYPHLYYDYLNSLAVELGEVGRVEEALNASRIALASPFASAYPEWRETGDELKMRGCRPSHNFVAFNAGFNQRSSDTGNVVTLPVSTRGNSAEPVKAGYNPFQQPARILDFQSWKKTMRKESNDTPKDEKTKKEMTSREMLLKLIELISEKDLTDDQLERMLEAVESIACESQNKDRQ